MNQHANISTRISTGTTLNASAFARATSLRRDAVVSMVRVGMLPDLSMGTAHSLAGTAIAYRVLDTENPIAVVRLGERAEDGARSTGWCDGLTSDEVKDVALRWWTRVPASAAESEVLHVTFKGIVVAVLRLRGIAESNAYGKIAFEGEVISWLVDTVGGRVEGPEERSELTDLELAADARVGQQMATSGGGPIVVEHPKASVA
ncbi:hypothetical protein [Brachybacterium alimentarium]|uniref:hypothetical protein n=1 Tax=Brachybacterium alimentarium TaxID=47845 RepID=UPI003FD5FAF3